MGEESIIGTLLALGTAMGGAGSATAPVAAATDESQVVRVDRDDTRVTTSCRLEFAGTPIFDANDDGVVIIEGDGIVVDLGAGTLSGCEPSSPPWTRTGIGIVVRGKGVTLRNGAVRGFRVGVLAQRSDGFVAQDLDLSGNYGARLLSTPAAETSGDWLWPHTNDASEWRLRYGAALCIEQSRACTIERIRAVGAGAQNGIVLDRVDDSKVLANDCSFLSGWGIALWRSSRNVIARNSFDFCVRGYSHGVYNRGQDSAGILLFEQCSENLIAINSVTHGGDGIFIFAGNEALGPVVAGQGSTGDAAGDPSIERSRGAGCNRNWIIGNDCSYAVAHGIELTFSFDNVLALNTMKECGICGIWGGYSRGTRIVGNVLERNGRSTNPGEEAGLSAEHAQGLLVAQNSFRDQGVGIKLWWDDDAELLTRAWARANDGACRNNAIVDNSFERGRVGVEVRGCTEVTVFGNSFKDVETPTSAEPAVASERPDRSGGGSAVEVVLEARRRVSGIPGTREPIGTKAQLGGRDKIIMTDRGPYDWVEPRLVFDRHEGREHIWRLLGDARFESASIRNSQGALLGGSAAERKVVVYSARPDLVLPYELEVVVTGREEPVTARGTLVDANWAATFFAWTVDPREDLEGWRREAGVGDHVELGAIDLPFGSEGPSHLGLSPLLDQASLPKDHFGMIARTTINMPKGTYRIRLLSDDGVRLKVDGTTLIERWDRHGPTVDFANLVVEERRDAEFELEYFEIDGHATLRLSLDHTEMVTPPAASIELPADLLAPTRP